MTQYVILGAGLDSFAYRTARATGGPDRIFEVHHPGTQDWKRAHLAAAGIGEPDRVSFVPVDFEARLAGRPPRPGRVRPVESTRVSWLGVTMYLTQAAITQTLAEIGGFAPGTQLITDYMLPPGLRDEAGATYAPLAAVAAERGEPWLTLLAPGDMTALLEQHGFGLIEHVHQRDSVPAALWDRTDSLRPAALSVLARATVMATTGRT